MTTSKTNSPMTTFRNVLLLYSRTLYMCSFFHICSKYVLQEPNSIEDGIGAPDWRLTLCLLFSWISIFVVIVRGVKGSGKAAYFLALFPYVIMITLLIRGATLPGAGQGILFFIEPQWGELLNPEVSEMMGSAYLMTSNASIEM